MREVTFSRLESEMKDKGQRIEVEAVVPAECVAEVMDEFYSLMARVRGMDASDFESIRSRLVEMVGEEDLDLACKDFLLNRFTMAAVRKLAFDTVLTPGVHAEAVPRRGEEFSFAINLIPRPDLSLSSIEPVEVEDSVIVVEEADIDEAMSYTVRDFTGLRKIDRTVLYEGDFALVDVDMTCNGKPCKNLTGQRRTIEVKRGLLPDAFVSGVAGMEVGEMRKLSFDVLIPAIGEVPAGADHYEADVKLWEVQEKVVPEVTDEWVAKNLIFDSIAAWRAQIRADLEEQKGKVEHQDAIGKIRSAIEKRLVGTIPDEMYQEAKDSLMASTVKKIEAQGMTLEEYCDQMGIGVDSFNMNVFIQASGYLRQNLALDILARERGLIETDEDVARAKAALPAAVARLSDEEFAERGFRRSVGEHIRREKAMKWLMETAVVKR